MGHSISDQNNPPLISLKLGAHVVSDSTSNHNQYLWSIVYGFQDKAQLKWLVLQKFWPTLLHWNGFFLNTVHFYEKLNIPPDSSYFELSFGMLNGWVNHS